MTEFQADVSEAEKLRDDYLADIWEEFVHQEDPWTLANYLSLGGEISEDVKTAIIYALRYRTKAKQQRQQNQWRDRAVYVAVSNLLCINRLAAKLHEKFPDKCAAPKDLSLGQALNWYATTRGFQLQTVRAQYKRGKAMVKEDAATV